MASHCATCGKTASSLCSWCKLVYYCSKKCQKNHWKQHKKICKWSVNKNKAKTNQTNDRNDKQRRNKPFFIQTAPGVWSHTGEPQKPTIERYRQLYRDFASLPNVSENVPEPMIQQTNINSLSEFIQSLPSTIANQQLSKSIISLKQGPLQTIGNESLRIIIKKSVKRWINISDFIAAEICSFHYRYQPFDASHLIIALLSNSKQTNNTLLRHYFRHAKTSPFDDDIDFERSEELFESQKPLSLESIGECIDKSIFRKLKNKFKDLVNYMNSNLFDCHILTNHITDDMSFFHDLFIFMVGVPANGGLHGVLLHIYDSEGNVW